LLITHWHLDHYGSVGGLSQRMPIEHFYDRGIPATLEEDAKNFPLLIQAYRAAGGNKSRTLKPGDEIALKSARGTPTPRLLCLCGNEQHIPEKPGATSNPVNDE